MSGYSVQGKITFNGGDNCYAGGDKCGPVRYRVSVTIPEGDYAQDANVHGRTEFFACDDESHLGAATAYMTRNGYGAPVTVIRYAKDWRDKGDTTKYPGEVYGRPLWVIAADYWQTREILDGGETHEDRDDVLSAIREELRTAMGAPDTDAGWESTDRFLREHRDH